MRALGARIDHMLFFAMKSRLVILTRTLVLVQLHIAIDGKVTPVMKSKVSVAGRTVERGIKSICWVGPGIIAAATGEVGEIGLRLGMQSPDKPLLDDRPAKSGVDSLLEPCKR